MAAQFFSALADNALIIAAIAALRDMDAPAEYEPLLRTVFTVSYVALAAVVGAFADSMPKGRVMLVCNTIKITGCLMMLFGGHPLIVYAIVGLGAASYAPAKYGILTEYLLALRIRPGVRLATALQYGIHADTDGFARLAGELDLRAYLSLGKIADPTLLQRIMYSEYLLGWLKFFPRAFSSLHRCGAAGRFAFIGEVDSPDIPVVVADFFNRVHELRWVVIGGVHAGTVILIFRGDGRYVDLGRSASLRFGALGSAGGHRSMARAEFPVAAADGRNLEAFIFKRLTEDAGHLQPRQEEKTHGSHPSRAQ